MKNDINVEALKGYMSQLSQGNEPGSIDYSLNLEWIGGTQTKVHTQEIVLDNNIQKRDFTFMIDEPLELLGKNEYPTPQEYLLAGMGSCMMVGFAVGASMKGIELEKLNIKIESGLDLNGFLQTKPGSPIPLKQVNYVIEVEGSGTKEEFDEIHEVVKKTSPNRATIANAIEIVSDLKVLD